MFSSETIWDTERGNSLYKISTGFKNNIPKTYTQANVYFNDINSSKILYFLLICMSHTPPFVHCLGRAGNICHSRILPLLMKSCGGNGRPFSLSGFSSNTGCISQYVFYRLWEMEDKNEIGWHLLRKKVILRMPRS